MTTTPNHSSKLELDWYKDVIDRSPDTFDVIDQDGVILYTNDKYTPPGKDSIVGTTIYDYFLPEFFPTVKQKIANVFKTGKNDFYELATQYNNELRWYMTKLGPVFRNGKVAAVTLFIREITDLKRAEQNLKEINENLEQRVKERTQILHEYASRLEASEKLNSLLRKAVDRDEVFSIIVNNGFQAFQANLVGIYYLEDDQLKYATSHGNKTIPPEKLQSDADSIFYESLSHKKTSHLQVKQSKLTGCQFCKYIHEEQMSSLWLAPLRTEDTVVGIMYLGFLETRTFTTDDEQLLNVFIDAGGNTLHRVFVMERYKQTIENREEELNVLYDIMSIAVETENLDELLKTSLEKILPVVKCEVGIIHLTEENQLIKTIIAGENEESEKIWIRQILEKYDIYNRGIHFQDRYYFEEISEINLSFLSIPIRTKGTVSGLLTVAGNCLQPEDLGTVSLIISIADEIGLVIESIKQRKKAEELLILEERQRLARDLHDSVSQSLYGLVISADVSNKLLKIKEFDGLQETLQDIEETALQALKEMRLMLFELRPLFFDTVGLVGALELRLNTVEKRAGIKTTFRTKNSELIHSPLDIEIYRITTEALNNSLKHAKANEIVVTISANQNSIHLTIQDDGKGFELKDQEEGGIGFSSMRERTNRINGKLKIESKKGIGTKVYVSIPLLRSETEEIS